MIYFFSVAWLRELGRRIHSKIVLATGVAWVRRGGEWGARP